MGVPSSMMKYVWSAPNLASPRTFHLRPVCLDCTCLPLRFLLMSYVFWEPYEMSSCIALLQPSFIQMKSSTPVRGCEGM